MNCVLGLLVKPEFESKQWTFSLVFDAFLWYWLLKNKYCILEPTLHFWKSPQNDKDLKEEVSKPWLSWLLN